jgi:hypothetical protein
MPDNIDYGSLCEHSGRRIMDADGVAQDVVNVLNNFPSKKSALDAAVAMRAEAVASGSYMRAFIIDSAVRVLENDVESEEDGNDG